MPSECNNGQIPVVFRDLIVAVVVEEDGKGGK